MERALAKNFARYGPHFYDLNFNPKYSLRPRPAYHPPARRYRCRGVFAHQKSSLFRLYLYYCYQLGIYPKRPVPRVNWPEINALWRDIDKTLEELHLTSERGFSTVAQVKAHRETLAGQFTALCQERADCARQLRWKEPPPEASQRRAELTRQIAALRKEDAAAQRIIEAKRATYYGIGMSLVRIVRAVLSNENSVLTVSARLRGEYGQRDVFAGVPCIVNRNGVDRVLELSLTEEERQKLADSCAILQENYQGLEL